MSQRLKQLQQLLQIKEQERQQAYGQLIHAKEQFEQNKAKHEQLVGYRHDYLQQLDDLGKQGGELGRLRNRIEFINHLDTALIQLNTFLAQLAKQRSKAEQHYQMTKRAEEGVSKLIERVQKTELIKLQRQEQKESDEYAQKQWYSRNNHDQVE